MVYRRRLNFLRPSAADVVRSRRMMIWLTPILILQQGVGIFNGASPESTFIKIALWGVLTAALLWWLLGLPMRWMDEDDQRKLNDEWSRHVSGDASRWALAAVALLGVGLMLAQTRWPLDPSKAIFALVNGGLLTAAARHAWLNRGGGADEDE